MYVLIYVYFQCLQISISKNKKLWIEDENDRLFIVDSNGKRMTLYYRYY